MQKNTRMMGTVSARVLLMHAPFKNLAWGKNWVGTESMTAPLGLMYLGGPLLKHGYHVEFIDLNVDRFEKDEFLRIVKTMDFILICVYSDSLENVNELIPLMRTVNPNAYVVCGGPYCNLSEKHVPGSDMTVIGEAEERITEILGRVSDREEITDVPGLIFRANGRLTRNRGVLKVTDISQSYHALWELASDKEYGYLFGAKIEGLTLMMTSRGCPYRCTYCTHKGIIPYRERSIENVLQELHLMQRNGIRHVVFDDDNFLMNKKRALALLENAKKQSIRLNFIIQGRVDSANRDFYKQLRKAGVKMIMFGIENGNQDVLDYYKKGITTDQTRHAISIAHELGIMTLGFFIIGSKLEGKKHFLANKEFVNSIPLDWLNINILGYYEGSPLWEETVRKGLIEHNETIVYANEKLSQYSYAEWQQQKEIILKEFYTSPSRIIRILHKSVRLGILGIFLRIIWHSRSNFFERIKSPFIEDTSKVEPRIKTRMVQ